jgi:hypothetical protein
MAILLVYLSLLFVEKKQRHKLLKQAEHSKCNSKIANASFEYISPHLSFQGKKFA